MQNEYGRILERGKNFVPGFGKIRPVISTEFKEWRITAVGDELHYQRKEDAQHFPDFLRGYLKNKLSAEFIEAEILKSPAEQHTVIQWFNRMGDQQAEYARKHDAKKGFPATGVLNAIFRLAYDLYLTKHHADLQSLLLSRLRKPKNFQGARFELVAITTLLCAGYRVEFEEEDDASGKHVEFLARSDNGVLIAVEAKSRHREGVLGYSRGGRHTGKPMSTSLGVDALLAEALAKKPSTPYLIFIDVNLPYVSAQGPSESLCEEIQESVNKAVRSFPPGECPASAFIFCNDPSHYRLDSESQSGDAWCLFAPVEHPSMPLKLDLIVEILKSYTSRLNIPTHFFIPVAQSD